MTTIETSELPPPLPPTWSFFGTNRCGTEILTPDARFLPEPVAATAAEADDDVDDRDDDDGGGGGGGSDGSGGVVASGVFVDESRSLNGSRWTSATTTSVTWTNDDDATT